MMVGDNIYHQDVGTENWTQEDSHHSNPDGSPNVENLSTDTSSCNVLVSDHFYYFGKVAPAVDLESIGYKNRRNYNKKLISDAAVANLINWIEQCYKKEINLVQGDPFNFSSASKRVNQATGRIL